MLGHVLPLELGQEVPEHHSPEQPAGRWGLASSGRRGDSAEVSAGGRRGRARGGPPRSQQRRAPSGLRSGPGRAAPRMPVPRAPRGRAGPASCACHSAAGEGKRRAGGGGDGGTGPGRAAPLLALTPPPPSSHPAAVLPSGGGEEEAAAPQPPLPGAGAGAPRAAAMSTGEVERLAADLGGGPGDEEEEWLYGGTDPRHP